MSNETTTEEKRELRVSVQAKTDDAIRKLAEERSMGVGEATDHLVKVASSRLRALRTYAKKQPKVAKPAKATKAKKAPKKARAAEPKAAKPKKARKAKEAAPAPAAEAAPATT